MTSNPIAEDEAAVLDPDGQLDRLTAERDAARYQLQRWLDWCFDESGTHARPDKWTRELLEGRPLTGADVNDAIRTKDARLAMQATEIEELETSRDALLTAAKAFFALYDAGMWGTPEIREAMFAQRSLIDPLNVPSELAPSQEKSE